ADGGARSITRGTFAWKSLVDQSADVEMRSAAVQTEAEPRESLTIEGAAEGAAEGALVHKEAQTEESEAVEAGKSHRAEWKEGDEDQQQQPEAQDAQQKDREEEGKGQQEAGVEAKEEGNEAKKEGQRSQRNQGNSSGEVEGGSGPATKEEAIRDDSDGRPPTREDVAAEGSSAAAANDGSVELELEEGALLQEALNLRDYSSASFPQLDRWGGQVAAEEAAALTSHLGQSSEPGNGAPSNHL
ncbi:unnamed protein product, partial [Symbiodinium sp. KB8]